MKFEDILVCNFELSTCFVTDLAFNKQLVSQEEKCSAIYASPLVQKKVNVLAERGDSDIVIEVAENEEQSEASENMTSVGDDRPLNKSIDQSNLESNRMNWASQTFNPYVEDVFSLGLTILQSAYQCSGVELKQMRQDPEHLIKAIEQMNNLYSDNLCCILLLMLQWENVTRPDFITLEHLIKNDILQLTGEGAAAGLFKRLCGAMT